MRNFDLRKQFLLITFLGAALSTWAQAPLIWGTSPFQDSMWSVDTSSYSVVHRIAPSLSGFTITGMTGMAWDPVGHESYVIMKVSGVSGRVLGKIDPFTGICTQVGNLGDNFATINFREDGQLFGVTGNGATVPETMYLIDKTNGTKTLAAALGAGVDGEIISYNYDDDFFYHWSGNGTVVMEKVMSVAPYTATNIPVLGTPGGETFGALYIGNNNFILSNINSSFRRCNANGTFDATSLINLPDDLRGLIMPPSASVTNDTICLNETFGWNLMPGQAQDTAVYHWGDGTSTTVFPAGSATHTYSTPGTYDSHFILKNSIVGEDTMMTVTVKVNALPLVVLNPGADTLMCFVDSLNVVATGGGTSQWYLNGAPITGANTNSLTVTADGVYNMIKVNLNGCQDSSAAGIKVTFGDQPFVDLGADSTICDGDSICWGLNNPVGVTYQWSNGSTSNSICATTSGTYGATATDPAGCAQTDDVVLTVLQMPVVSVTVDTSNCPTVVFTDNGQNATDWLWDFGDGNTGTGNPASHTFGSNGVYSGMLVASNACFSATDSGTVTINCIIGVENSLSNNIHIAPNPSNGLFMLTAALPVASSLSYEISDLSGRVLLRKSSDEVRSSWSETIDFNGASGLYFITLRAGEDMAVYRLVIE